jgi:putative ABC transport system permease protein
MMAALLRNLRRALRRLARFPGSTLAALFTLALGSGATYAVFSAAETVFLRPLPYPESERLVTVSAGVDPDAREPIAAADLAFWQAQEGSGFQALTAYTHWLVTAGPRGAPEMLLALQLGGDFHSVVGVQPVRGRGLTREDQLPGAEPVVLVSHELAERLPGGGSGVLGTGIELGGELHNVVGVMPRGFRFPVKDELPGQRVEVWLPLRLTPAQWADPGYRFLDGVARLAPGIDLREARARTAVLASGTGEDGTSAVAQHRIALTSLHEATVGHLRLPFAILMTAVLCVFLVCCANVATLMLSRAVASGRSTAMKLALGARWRNLADDWLYEGVVLGVAGSAMGLLLAYWGIELFRRLDPARLPRIDDVALGIPAVLLALPVSAAAAGLGALAAILLARGTDLQATLKEGAQQAVGIGARRRHIGRALVLFEIATATLLAISAGLLVRSYLELRSVELGFETDRALTAWVLLPDARYPDPSDQARFFERFFDRLQNEPRIEVAGGVTHLPLTPSHWGTSLRLVGGELPGGREFLNAEFRPATPGYFDALRIPLKAGRRLEHGDHAGSGPVAVIDEALAARITGSDDPARAVGKVLHLDAASGQQWDVVGVVGSTRQSEPRAPPVPTLYVPHAQFPTPLLVMTVRTTGDPRAAVETVRTSLLSLDPDQPMFYVQTMGELLATATAEERVRSILLLLLAGLALVLAVLGVYGSVAHSVALRSREFAIRLALGASPRGIGRQVLRGGIGLASAGIALGLLLAVGSTRVLAGLLYGVEVRDGLVFLTVVLLLECAALIACYPLARRAGQVEPARALAEA